jgi:hypothetical protein
MDEKIYSRDDSINIEILERTDADTELLRIKKYEKLEKILQEANARSEKQHTIFEEVEKQSKTGFGDLPLSNPTMADLQNPQYAHNLYYKQLRPLMRAYFPKGSDGRELRNEINIFLKEGYRVGRDGRQAYTKTMVQAVNVLKNWVNEFRGTQLVDLFYRFRDLNKELRETQ